MQGYDEINAKVGIDEPSERFSFSAEHTGTRQGYRGDQTIQEDFWTIWRNDSMARDASRIRGILRRFLESVTNCRSRLDNVLAKTIYARTASGWAVGAAGLGQRAGKSAGEIL